MLRDLYDVELSMVCVEVEQGVSCSSLFAVACVCVWVYHRLDLTSNPRIAALPVGLGLLTDLRVLWLSGCPSLGIPEHLKRNMGKWPKLWVDPITGKHEDVAEAVQYAQEHPEDLSDLEPVAAGQGTTVEQLLRLTE